MKSIHVLRKPCSESTVAANVLRHGTGGLNVNGSRIAWANEADAEIAAGANASFAKSERAGRIIKSPSIGRESRDGTEAPYTPPAQGRWPANLVLGACLDSELDEVFPHNKGKVGMTQHSSRNNVYGGFRAGVLSRVNDGADDEGSAARYFKRVSE